MRIGFTFEKTEEKLLQEKCDRVIVSSEGASVTKVFEKFVKDYPDDEIYLYSLEAANMQLAQLHPAMTFLKRNSKLLHFIKKDPLATMSDKEFFDILYQFSVIEVNIMRVRTEKGIALAKDQGLYPGRPKIDQAIIEKIQRLYKNKRQTFQEIAEECQVSVGTVHKYVVKYREEEEAR